jgi:hypothetical protein
MLRRAALGALLVSLYLGFAHAKDGVVELDEFSWPLVVDGARDVLVAFKEFSYKEPEHWKEIAKADELKVRSVPSLVLPPATDSRVFFADRTDADRHRRLPQRPEAVREVRRRRWERELPADKGIGRCASRPVFSLCMCCVYVLIC